MIRHSALFVFGPGAGAEERSRVKDGVAYCFYASGVLALDFGEELGLLPSRHGFALMHDHRDRAAWDDYNANATHARVGALLKAITVPELAARVDWLYDGPPARRGGARHLGLYRWDERTGARARAELLAGLAALPTRCREIAWLGSGADLGWYPPNYDWALEAQFASLEALAAFNDDPAWRELSARVDAATRERAQVQLRMLAG